jgi:subtilase family serine protease
MSPLLLNDVDSDTINKKMERIMRYILFFILLLTVIACEPIDNDSTGSNNNDGNRNPSQPDLEITDISARRESGYPDDVIINAVVHNRGSAFNEDFAVWCEYSCNGNPNFFAVGTVQNGMGAGASQTLGGDTLLSLSACSVSSFREFTCTADPDGFIDESNESNNERTENLNTGR